jgi:hypothetical protein
MRIHTDMKPRGTVRQRVERELGVLPPPKGWRLRNWLRHRRRELPQGVALALLGAVDGVVSMQSELRGKVYRPSLAALAPERLARMKELLVSNFDLNLLPAIFGGQTLEYGVLSHRSVTTAGVNFIVDAFQNTTEVENFKFHAYGTGSVAENITDVGL